MHPNRIKCRGSNPQGQFEIPRGGHVANSNLGNGYLRPETLGETRRERSPERAKPTAETGSPRTGYGNVGLFLTLGSHVGLRGLPGGGRSPVKPVSKDWRSLVTGRKTGISIENREFGIL